MEKIDLGDRRFKSMAEAKNVARKLSERGPQHYVFMVVVFDEVTFYAADRLPYSDHAANDYPLGYWHKGEHHQWSEARKIRAQNAGETCDR